MCNCVGRTSFHTESAKDTSSVINVVNPCVSFTPAESLLFGVFGSLNIDTICWTGCCAQKTCNALLQSVLISLQHMCAAEAFLESRRPIWILLGNCGLQHFLEGDAHAFGNGRSRANHLANFCHPVLRLAQV